MELLGNALREKNDDDDDRLIQTLLLEQLHRTPRVMVDLQTLFIVLAYVRDIDGGMGERQLTYMMLDVWYERFPVMAVYALEALILCGYGSWRDVPGLCNYLKNFSIRRRRRRRKEEEEDYHPFILTAVDFMLRHVVVHDDGLAAKWVPRETSKKNLWLFELFVKRSAVGGSRRQFRRMISEKTRGSVGTATSAGLSPRFCSGSKALSSWMKRGRRSRGCWTLFARNKYYPLNDDDGNDGRSVLCVLPAHEKKKDTEHVLVETLLLLEKMKMKMEEVEEREDPSWVVVLTTDPLSFVTLRVSDGFSHNVARLLSAVDGACSRRSSLDATLEALQQQQQQQTGSQPYFMFVVGGQRPSLYAVAAHPRYDPMRVLFDRLVI